MRVATPGTTILKSTPGSIQQTIGGKQIITVHKAGGGSSGTGHPQIVTLVKTNQGMQVATVRITRWFYHLVEFSYIYSMYIL